jgi:hypothetical protein
MTLIRAVMRAVAGYQLLPWTNTEPHSHLGLAWQMPTWPPSSRTCRDSALPILVSWARAWRQQSKLARATRLIRLSRGHARIGLNSRTINFGRNSHCPFFVRVPETTIPKNHRVQQRSGLVFVELGQLVQALVTFYFRMAFKRSSTHIAYLLCHNFARTMWHYMCVNR